MKDNDFWGSMLIIFMFSILLWGFSSLKERVGEVERKCAVVEVLYEQNR